MKTAKNKKITAAPVEAPAPVQKKKRFGIFGWIKRHKFLVGIIIIAIAGGAILFAPKKEKVEYSTVPITRGALRQVVTATGEIRPVNTIKVGSQVSGLIEAIYVDYNSQVKKGDVLLRIDPSVLQATVDESKAALDSALAQQSFDKSEFDRSKALFNDGFIARSEMEQAKTRYETSTQSVKRARSQYERATTNLGYATITSPVDGTVISRKVDRGQTVAASFQAPDLFEIAEDLSEMQIQTNVSEADIGMIKEDQEVTFTVDAYPTQTFVGKVSQIRLSPTTTQNVVVYTVIIKVDNSDLRLMPGMTAFVTIVIAEREDVWKTQNAAFLVRNLKALSDDPRVQNGDMTARNTMLIKRGSTNVLVPFEKGLVSTTETEIIAEGIQKGDLIITGKLGQASTGSGQMPQQRGGPGGGGGIGGGGSMGGGGGRR